MERTTQLAWSFLLATATLSMGALGEEIVVFVGGLGTWGEDEMFGIPYVFTEFTRQQWYSTQLHNSLTLYLIFVVLAIGVLKVRFWMCFFPENSSITRKK
jgi:hypothetical protein